MIRDKYERTLDHFKRQYPSFYERAVDWWATGRMSIAIKLNDGVVYDYDPMDDSLRQVAFDVDIDNDVARKIFGNNVQKMLPFSGLTKSELADKAGVSSVMLSKYIRGTSIPSVVIARKIASALGCTIDELFDDTYI